MDEYTHRNLPKNITDNDFVFFKDAIKFKLSKKEILNLKYAFVLKYGAVVHKGSIVDESLANPKRHGHQYTLKFFIKSLFFFKKRLFIKNKILLVYDSWSGNIFHWLTDVLPRLYLVRNDILQYKIIFPEEFRMYDYVIHTLANLEVIDNVVWVKEDCFLFVRDLTLPCHIAYSGNYDHKILQTVARDIKKKLNHRTEGKRVYISRSLAKTRRIINESEVSILLKQLDFHICHFEELTFIEQMNIAASARILISPHGAGLTHIMFLEQNSSVLELRTKGNPQNNCYFNLSDAFGIDYYYLMCNSKENNNDFQNDDMFVDLTKLKELIDRIISNTYA
jgi:capsular polysaccharide biosynthesis protein